MFNSSLKHAFILVTATLCNAAAAQCTPGGWALSEVFSNADGSVQFAMLESAVQGIAPGSLVGQTLVASDGSTEHDYTFASDAPDATRPVLVATQSFANLNLVQPDFVVPDGFAPTTGGSLSLAGGDRCGAAIQYDALPTDGVNAYYPDMSGDGVPSTGNAQAANNAGDAYAFTANYSGLWWNSPSGSEPDSDIAIDHQRDIVFAAWATHDSDGSPAWFVMPAAARVSSADAGVVSFEGPIYRTSGPAFGALPFDPSAVQVTEVGSGHFDFVDDATFSYTIGAASGTSSVTRRNIMQQAFGEPLAVCNEVGPAGPTPNFQGMWWNPAESGWGLYIAHQGNTIFAVWFAYDTTGKVTWLTLAASRTDSQTYAGPVFRTTGPSFDAAYDPAAVSDTQVGSATLTFSDRNNGTFSSIVNGIAQNETITRQVFVDPPTVCN